MKYKLYVVLGVFGIILYLISFFAAITGAIDGLQSIESTRFRGEYPRWVIVGGLGWLCMISSVQYIKPKRLKKLLKKKNQIVLAIPFILLLILALI